MVTRPACLCSYFVFVLFLLLFFVSTFSSLCSFQYHLYFLYCRICVESFFPFQGIWQLYSHAILKPEAGTNWWWASWPFTVGGRVGGPERHCGLSINSLTFYRSLNGANDWLDNRTNENGT